MDETRQTPGGRGRRGLPPYPDGVPQTERYVINAYGTIGNRMKPPFTTIVKYDLNEPAIKWRIGFGDDPALAARGITGTGVTQMRNSIIVTESGLVFGAGRDNQIRAWDSDDGQAALVIAVRRQLRRLTRDVRDGRQAVPARPGIGTGRRPGWRTGVAAAPARLRGAPAATGPMGLGRVRAAGEISRRLESMQSSFTDMSPFNRREFLSGLGKTGALLAAGPWLSVHRIRAKRSRAGTRVPPTID